MEFNIKFDEKMIVEVANSVLDEYEYNGKTIREWADLIANPKTNADRIRAMSEREFAEWLDAVSKAWYDEGYTKETDEPLMSPYPSTASKWLEWLKEDAE